MGVTEIFPGRVLPFDSASAEAFGHEYSMAPRGSVDKLSPAELERMRQAIDDPGVAALFVELQRRSAQQLGDAETELVGSLLRLQRTLESQPSGAARSAEVEAARAQVVNLVNTFFHDRLVLLPSIEQYMARLQSEDTATAH